jgi:XTP/dITP diphosphohydrolase
LLGDLLILSKNPKVLLATNNRAKVREFLALLQGMPFVFTTPEQEGLRIEVEESGTTLEENAILKAKAYSEASGLVALADDSGLEVDALGGRPGILSARYGREGASDKEKFEQLLSELSGVSWEQRKARFRCVIAIATPNGKLELCYGECEGFIAFEPHGRGGFGYDPVFFVPEFGKTMAELSFEEKNNVSHRGKATKKAREILNRLIPESG